MTALSAISMAFILLVGMGLIKYRQEEAVRMFAPRIYSVMIIGALMLLCVPLVWNLHPTPETCLARVWLLQLGWTALFAPIAIKLERIRRIFNSKRLHTVKLTDWALIRVFLGIVVFDVVFTLTWTFVASSDWAIFTVTPDPIRKSFNYVECASSDEGTGFAIGAVVCKAFMVLVCVVIAVATRKVNDKWNESPNVGGAVYNLTLVGVIVLPIVALGVGGREFSHVIRSLGLIFIAVSTCAIVPGYRVVAAMLQWKVSLDLSTHGSSNAGSGDSAARKYRQTRVINVGA